MCRRIDEEPFAHNWNGSFVSNAVVDEAELSRRVSCDVGRKPFRLKSTKRTLPTTRHANDFGINADSIVTGTLGFEASASTTIGNLNFWVIAPDNDRYDDRGIAEHGPADGEDYLLSDGRTWDDCTWNVQSRTNNRGFTEVRRAEAARPELGELEMGFWQNNTKLRQSCSHHGIRYWSPIPNLPPNILSCAKVNRTLNKIAK